MHEQSSFFASIVLERLYSSKRSRLLRIDWPSWTRLCLARRGSRLGCWPRYPVNPPGLFPSQLLKSVRRSEEFTSSPFPSVGKIVDNLNLCPSCLFRNSDNREKEHSFMKHLSSVNRSTSHHVLRHRYFLYLYHLTWECLLHQVQLMPTTVRLRSKSWQLSSKVLLFGFSSNTSDNMYAVPLLPNNPTSKISLPILYLPKLNRTTPPSTVSPYTSQTPQFLNHNSIILPRVKL
jgi:hypothetical protein